MQIENFEFKARVDAYEPYEQKLQSLNPDFIGEDFQKDTYFKVNKGRLKLREGNIENALIWYNRADVADIKPSQILLYKHKPDAALKEILNLQFSILTVVEKKRRIYFKDNVKFHFDAVKGLGAFIEVEAINNDHTIPNEKLKKQCDAYFQFFGLAEYQLLQESYSDLLIALSKA